VEEAELVGHLPDLGKGTSRPLSLHPKALGPVPPTVDAGRQSEGGARHGRCIHLDEMGRLSPETGTKMVRTSPQRRQSPASCHLQGLAASISISPRTLSLAPYASLTLSPTPLFTAFGTPDFLCSSDSWGQGLPQDLCTCCFS
jgi:hypothetical protein